MNRYPHTNIKKKLFQNFLSAYRYENIKSQLNKLSRGWSVCVRDAVVPFVSSLHRSYLLTYSQWTDPPAIMKLFLLSDCISELIPSDSYTPTLHLIAYSVNQKGRSEPTILEDIAINEAEKRTGRYFSKFLLPTKKNQLGPDWLGLSALDSVHADC